MNYATFLSSLALWLLRPSSHGDHARQTVAYFFPKVRKTICDQSKTGDCCNKLGTTPTPACSVGATVCFQQPKVLVVVCLSLASPPSCMFIWRTDEMTIGGTGNYLSTGLAWDSGWQEPSAALVNASSVRKRWGQKATAALWQRGSDRGASSKRRGRNWQSRSTAICSGAYRARVLKSLLL